MYTNTIHCPTIGTHNRDHHTSVQFKMVFTCTGNPMMHFTSSLRSFPSAAFESLPVLMEQLATSRNTTNTYMCNAPTPSPKHSCNSSNHSIVCKSRELFSGLCPRQVMLCVYYVYQEHSHSKQCCVFTVFIRSTAKLGSIVF